MTNKFSYSITASISALVFLWIQPVSHAGEVSSDCSVSSISFDQAPSAAENDLAQAHYRKSSATGFYESQAEHAQLFNGLVGNNDADSDDDGEVRVGDRTSITVDLDVSKHKKGYDITAINLYFGEEAPAKFRTNQKYSVELTFMNNTTEVIRPKHVDIKPSTSYWNLISFRSKNNALLASGVKSVTFTLSEKVNSKGLAIAREIDILGSSSSEEVYSMVLKSPNGNRVPKILGASGDLAKRTGYDYFDWYGITEHRTWFKPSFSTLTDDKGINSAEDFKEATQAIRKNPEKQATPTDYFIDWKHFHREVNRNEMSETVKYLAARNITPLITNTTFISKKPITDDWMKRFQYWRYWYTIVYHFASQHDITMYAFRNEPHAKGDYDTWESHWLVCADAMRKAMEDVNKDFKKDLKVQISGPNCPGVYWDYSFPHPDKDIHCWGSVSWEKVKYDIYGKYDVKNPWNYGMYHFHRYGEDPVRTEEIILNARKDIARAKNNPSKDIPLVITEFNTSTGGNFDKRKLDTEDLLFGISMAQNLHASAVHGEAGLGDDGGIFVFKLGAHQGGSSLVGLGNKLSYVSQSRPHNYGGVTRGGACFQMYARHFSGGKPLVPVTVRSGASEKRRTLAVLDEKNRAYYIYGSNVTDASLSVSIDLSALKVKSGTIASLQLVDRKNTGQVTDVLSLSSSKKLNFQIQDFTAFLIKIPMSGALSAYKKIEPSEDSTVTVLNPEVHGASPTMNVSTHHSDAAQRQASLLRFEIDGSGAPGKALLSLSGRNIGVDPFKREIVHVYAVKDKNWGEQTKIKWRDAPGLGEYHIGKETMEPADGTGKMVDIEDNYSGATSGSGTGLGITGEFIGAVSFHSPEYENNYLDVTDYLKSISTEGKAMDVTFVIVRIVRYNVNEYKNVYYTKGDYHYDGRVVEIATKEHTDSSFHPRLIYATEAK